MEELIEKSKAGDKDAFVRLMELNKTDLYRAAISILKNDDDVADAMQETVMSAYLNIGKLKNNAYFKTWLTKILINKCKDMIKANKKYVLDEEYVNHEKSNETVENEKEIINEYISGLDDKYRIILLLFYGEGFDIKEISQIMDMNVNTVKSRLKRGRAELEKMLSGKSDDKNNDKNNQKNYQTNHQEHRYQSRENIKMNSSRTNSNVKSSEQTEAVV